MVNYIQNNKENNPYKNKNCIIKVDESPTEYINKNYSKILGLSFLFIIPFLTPILLNYLNLDRYDIKKTEWIKNYVFISLFLPTLIIIYYRLTGHKSLEIFSTINKFIDDKDNNYINFVKRIFNLNFYIILIFLFILVIFLCLHWIYFSINKNVNTSYKYVYLCIIILLIYVIIPMILSKTAVSTIYYVYKENSISKDENDVISSIENNGSNSIYDLIIKYNYPCFKR